MTRTAAVTVSALATLLTFATAAEQATPSIHGRSARRLVIRNAMIIYGNAKPPYGPADLIVENGIISAIGSPSATAPDRPRYDQYRRDRQIRDARHRQRAHALA
jgi:hypothetical protein